MIEVPMEFKVKIKLQRVIVFEVARINHEAYKLANDFGMHYETNFSNLLKYDA